MESRKTERLPRGYKVNKWQNWVEELGLWCFSHSEEEFGVLSCRCWQGILLWISAETEDAHLTSTGGRGPVWALPGCSGLFLPCRLTPRGTRPCSSSVGRSSSAALELLGGIALLPPKVVREVSDILSFARSLGEEEETTEKGM